MKKLLPYILILLLITLHLVAVAQDRFPRPEFESGYVHPVNQLPKQRAQAWEYLDVAVLTGALSIASWLALKKRSRKGLVYLSLFSVAYFGFYRQGCICAVGSLQNVSLALFNTGYAIPLTALLFFIIPLVFALAFGRVFCAGVCPLGAIQEITGIKPLNIPKSAEVVLASVPFIYLGLSVLFASLDSDFLICRYDPFIGIFRLDAPYTMIIFGILLLLAGMIVSRPYCRFLCPYGVLLGIFSRFSFRHLTIAPSKCINCRLCENSCPYEAIIPSSNGETETAGKSRSRFLMYFVLIPVLAITGALVFDRLAPVLSGVNRNIRLAREIRVEKSTGVQSLSKEAVAFRESGQTEAQLFSEEKAMADRYQKSSKWVGIFLGLSLGFGLVRLSASSVRDEYLPDRGKCFSCGRCFKYCPVKE